MVVVLTRRSGGEIHQGGVREGVGWGGLGNEHVGERERERGGVEGLEVEKKGGGGCGDLGNGEVG